MQNMDVESKFDQLLNQKCSWSYRSQKTVTSQKVHTNTDGSPMELQETVMKIEISQNKYDEEPGDTDSNTDFNSKKHIRTKCSKPKAARNIVIKKKTVPPRKSKTLSTKENSISNSTVKPWKRNRSLPKIDSQTSSSDEEVLQARNPLHQQNYNLIGDDTDTSGISFTKETDTGKRINSVKSTNNKSLPIIIKATPCTSNESIQKNLDNQNRNTQCSSAEREETFEEFEAEVTRGLEIDSINSLCAEPNTPNLENDWNCNNETNKTVEVEQMNISQRNAVKNHCKKPATAYSFMENASVGNDRSTPSSQCLNNLETSLYDDPIISDFLNGSLDVSVYASPKKNYDISKRKESEPNFKIYSKKATKVFVDNMSSEPREKQNFFKRNKTLKQKNVYQTTNVSYSSPVIRYTTMPSNVKRKRSQEQNMYKKKKNDSIDYAVPYIEVSSHEKRGKNKYTTEIKKRSFECINVSSTEDEQKQKISNSRPKRHACLAASEKIKEIGKFENSAPSDDSDVCILYEENFSTALSQNIIQNLNKISKNNIMDESTKEQNKYFSDDTVDYDINLKTDRPEEKETSSYAMKNKAVLKLHENIFNDKFIKLKNQISNFKKQERKNIMSATVLHKNSEFTVGKQKNDNTANGVITNYVQHVKNVSKKNNVTTLHRSEGKQKTWENLEIELLKKVDNNLPSKIEMLKGNVSKTIIFKQNRLVKKSQDARDYNLITVSNTAVTQSFSKNTKSNTIQNSGKISKDLVPAHFTNKSVLERAIIAMEKCATNSLVPQSVNSLDVSGSTAQLEDDLLKCVEDTEFNTQNEEMPLTPHKIMNTGSDTKSKIKKKLKENNYMNQNNFNVSKQSQNGEKTFNINTPKTTCNQNVSNTNSNNKALVPFEKAPSNPWDDLIKKLNADMDDEQNLSNEDEYLKACTENGQSNKIDNFVRNTDISDEDMTNSKMLEVEHKKFTYPVNNILDDYNIPKENIVSSALGETSKTSSELIQNTAKTRNTKISKGINKNKLAVLGKKVKRKRKSSIKNKISNSKLFEAEQKAANSSYVQNILNDHALSDKSDLSNASCKISKNDSKLIEEICQVESIKKLNGLNKSTHAGSSKKVRKKPVQKRKKSLTFKMKTKEDGSMHLMLDTSSTSTKTSTPTLRRNNNEVQNVQGKNKSKDKYIKYLNNLFNKEDNMDTKEGAKGGENKDLSLNRNKNLLAENEEDLFSLSSDSDDNQEEHSCGTGLLCELFDEQ